MRVLLVITGLGVGGAERQVLDIADSLCLLGHEVVICYLTGSASLSPKSKTIKMYGLDTRKTIFSLIKSGLSIRHIVKTFQPDVVHSHMVHANLLMRVMRIFVRMPKLVCTAHNTYEGGPLRMLCYRLTASLADCTTNVSTEAVAAFESSGAVAPGRMIAVPNGIDTQRFRSMPNARNSFRKKVGAEESVFVILAVGRLTDAKDYPNLLRAYSTLQLSHQNTELWIIGDGDLKHTLIQMAANLCIRDRVRFLGIQSEIEYWMNAADIFVLSSAWEGFGLVVAEAMACEKLVVATDAGGVREVLSGAGFLVPKNRPDLLAEALSKAVVLEPDTVKHLGQQARAHIIKSYSLEKSVQQWLEIYSRDI